MMTGGFIPVEGNLFQHFLRGLCGCRRTKVEKDDVRELQSGCQKGQGNRDKALKFQT